MNLGDVMPYVVRSADNEIIEIAIDGNERASEYLPIDHPDVINFLTKVGDDIDARQLLVDYDASVPRVLEDLIDILIRNQVISFDQFPDEARKKLVTRQYLRNLIRQVDRT